MHNFHDLAATPHSVNLLPHEPHHLTAAALKTSERMSGHEINQEQNIMIIFRAVLAGCMLLLSGCETIAPITNSLSVNLDKRTNHRFLTTAKTVLPTDKMQPESLIGFWWTDGRPEYLVVVMDRRAKQRIEAISITLDDSEYRLKLATDLYRPATDGLQRNPFLDDTKEAGHTSRQFAVEATLAKEILDSKKAEISLFFLGDATSQISVSDSSLSRIKRALLALEQERAKIETPKEM